MPDGRLLCFYLVDSVSYEINLTVSVKQTYPIGSV